MQRGTKNWSLGLSRSMTYSLYVRTTSVVAGSVSYLELTSAVIVTITILIGLVLISTVQHQCISMCYTIVISFSRPSVFLLVFSMGNRKCTAWLSSLTVFNVICVLVLVCFEANYNTIQYNTIQV